MDVSIFRDLHGFSLYLHMCHCGCGYQMTRTHLSIQGEEKNPTAAMTHVHFDLKRNRTVCINKYVCMYVTQSRTRTARFTASVQKDRSFNKISE